MQSQPHARGRGSVGVLIEVALTTTGTTASETNDLDRAAVIFDGDFVWRDDDDATVLVDGDRIAQTFVHQ